MAVSSVQQLAQSVAGHGSALEGVLIWLLDMIIWLTLF